MKYFKRIKGDRLYLSPVNKGDLETFTRWVNDPDTIRYLPYNQRLISLVAEEKTLEKLVTEGQNYVIVTNDDVLIGSIALMEINHINRTATLGVFIGEAEYRGRGYGTEAIRLIINHGFKSLNLQNIMLVVHEDNTQGIECYKKVGFKEFGRRTKCEYSDGKYSDLIYMEILEV